jgi:hypothetical protein
MGFVYYTQDAASECNYTTTYTVITYLSPPGFIMKNVQK